MRMSLYRRKRLADHALAHNDGLRDLIDKLKRSLQALADKFSALPTGRKIAFVIGNILKLAGVMTSSYGAGNLVGYAIKLQEQWRTAKKLMEDGLVQGVDGVGFSTGTLLDPAIYKPMIKICGGLIATIVGTITATYAEHGVNANV